MPLGPKHSPSTAMVPLGGEGRKVVATRIRMLLFGLWQRSCLAADGLKSVKVRRADILV